MKEKRYLFRLCTPAGCARRWEGTMPMFLRKKRLTTFIRQLFQSPKRDSFGLRVRKSLGNFVMIRKTYIRHFFKDSFILIGGIFVEVLLVQLGSVERFIEATRNFQIFTSIVGGM